MVMVASPHCGFKMQIELQTAKRPKSLKISLFVKNPSKSVVREI